MMDFTLPVPQRFGSPIFPDGTVVSANPVERRNNDDSVTATSDGSVLQFEGLRPSEMYVAFGTVSGDRVETRFETTPDDSDGRTIVDPPQGSGGLDTGKIVDALTAAGNRGYGLIQLQDGTYSVDPDEVVLTARTELHGHGPNITRLEMTGDGVLVDMSGQSASRLIRAKVKGMQLRGGSNAGTLLRIYHVSMCHIEDVEGWAIEGEFLSYADAWDCHMKGYIECEFCGSLDGLTPAVWIRNNAAASGFGSVAGTVGTNMIHCNGHLRIEDATRGMIIERGPSSSLELFNLSFPTIKIETDRYCGAGEVTGELFRCNLGDRIWIGNIELVANSFLDGTSTAGKAMFWSPNRQSAIDLLHVRHNTTDVLNQGVQMWQGDGAHFVGAPIATGSAFASSGGLLAWQNTNPITLGSTPYVAAGVAETGTRPNRRGAPTITGIRASNTALADLLTDLDAQGYLTDSTTAT